jgi:hypothetical protein
MNGNEIAGTGYDTVNLMRLQRVNALASVGPSMVAMAALRL